MAFKRQTAKLAPGALTYFSGGRKTTDADGAAHLPVVYLHGRGGLTFSPAHDMLARNRKLYMPVTPGLDGTAFLPGVESMTTLADLVAEFIRKKAGGKCDLIGHSFGGWVAAWVAALHPDVVDLLVLAAPAGFRPGGKGGGAPDNDALHFQMLYAHPEKAPPDTRPPGTARANREAVKHYHKSRPLDEALVARLGEIKIPTLVLYGMEEQIIPIETCRILADALPRHSLIYMYDCGHMLPDEQPERFARVIGDFFDRGEAFIVPRAAE